MRELVPLKEICEANHSISLTKGLKYVPKQQKKNDQLRGEKTPQNEQKIWLANY